MTRIEFESFNCQAQQYPEDIDAFDFYVTSGSKSSAYDDEDWIKQLIAFVQKLDRAKKKLIGICFGHQIIALARGGKVSRSEKGWGVGMSHNQVLKQPSWMKQSTGDLKILVSHQDQVSEIKGNYEIIAGSDFCPHFILQWDQHFLSIQGHPEWQNSYSEDLIQFRSNIIPANRVEKGLASLSETSDNELFTRWVLDFRAEIDFLLGLAIYHS
ncbi:MAG: hypothetical protein Q9M92_16990 [Enterobacterales bacterium]|nr:hypothetical protein [Enterobacterales bacterium]